MLTGKELPMMPAFGRTLPLNATSIISAGIFWRGTLLTPSVMYSSRHTAMSRLWQILQCVTSTRGFLVCALWWGRTFLGYGNIGFHAWNIWGVTTPVPGKLSLRQQYSTTFHLFGMELCRRTVLKGPWWGRLWNNWRWRRASCVSGLRANSARPPAAFNVTKAPALRTIKFLH